MKTRYLYLGLLALVVLIWPFAPEIARATFTWNSLDWDTYTKTSQVFDKVGADTMYANVYENVPPGVAVGNTEPGDCNATDGFAGLLWTDTSGADIVLKWCNDNDGSYNWDPVAEADDIKAGVMALGVTGTYGEITNQMTYSGPTFNIDPASGSQYSRQIGEQADGSTEALLDLYCVGRGHSVHVSYTANNSGSAQRLRLIQANPPNLDSDWTGAADRVNGVVCGDRTL